MSDMATLVRRTGDLHFEVSVRGQYTHVHEEAEHVKSIVYAAAKLCAGKGDPATPSNPNSHHPVEDRIAIVGHFEPNRPVGAVQLMCATTNATTPVPMGLRYDLSDVLMKYPAHAVAEISSLAVLPSSQGSGLAWLFFDKIIDVARRNGIQVCVIAADACTDELSDAQLAFRIAQAQDLTSDRLTIAPRNTAPGDHAPQKHLYTRAHYVQALRNGWQHLKVREKPALYARRGARFVGEPTWEPTYHTCSLPMALFLD
ncbi:MAG TPA: GNAT family N-acetyltransferase [Polyangium sp.]|nr:GNAT family N-acetyltransferase [Polyangium sp.]